MVAALSSARNTSTRPWGNPIAQTGGVGDPAGRGGSVEPKEIVPRTMRYARDMPAHRGCHQSCLLLADSASPTGPSSDWPSTAATRHSPAKLATSGALTERGARSEPCTGGGSRFAGGDEVC